MRTEEILARLRERDVRVRVEDGRLKCDAPLGALDEDLREQLVARKQELLTLISAAETTLSAPGSLVPLKTSGDYPPLFARPGHNGDVFCYRALAEHFDKRRPLYGVEPKGLDGSPAAGTVEEMAAYEVAKIRELQPKGPYYIAGYCAGGTIAFEAARQLAAAGEDVSRLLLIGSPFPTTYRTPQAITQLRSLGRRVQRYAVALTTGSLAGVAEYVHDRLRARQSRAMADAALRKDPALENRRRIEEATVAAVKRYKPGSYAGRVDMFLPNDAWRRSRDRPDKWKRVSGRVVEHVGPDEANGDTMLLEPHVRAFATLVNASMHDEEVHHEAS